MLKIKCDNLICESTFFFDEQRYSNATEVRCPKCKTNLPIPIEHKQIPPPPLPQQPKAILALAVGKSVFPLKQGNNYIGRSVNNDIVLDQDPLISRRHALLEVVKTEKNDWRYILSDLHSQNGTYINEERLQQGEQVELQERNFFKVYNTQLRLTQLNN
jgi:FHA domain